MIWICESRTDEPAVTRQELVSGFSISGESLRGREGNPPRLDKVVRLDGFFSGYRASEIDAELIRKFIADEQQRGTREIGNGLQGAFPRRSRSDC